MTDNNGKVRPFGIKDKLGYMFGDFGNDFTFLLSAMFLLKFYTDVMGVSAALVGLMMMAARFVDAITDVTMGQIVDRSRPGKKGKICTMAQTNVRSCCISIISDVCDMV